MWQGEWWGFDLLTDIGRGSRVRQSRAEIWRKCVPEKRTLTGPRNTGHWTPGPAGRGRSWRSCQCWPWGRSPCETLLGGRGRYKEMTPFAPSADVGFADVTWTLLWSRRSCVVLWRVRGGERGRNPIRGDCLARKQWFLLEWPSIEGMRRIHE